MIAEAERRGFLKLVHRIFPESVASLVLRKVGFVEGGVYRGYSKLDGPWRDCVSAGELLGEAAEAWAAGPRPERPRGRSSSRR